MTDAAGESLLVVIDHHGAQIYHIDTAETETVKPRDPQGHRHSMTRKDQSRDQSPSEDKAFYEQIAHILMDAAHVVVIGHGHGHSDAAGHLIAHLQSHHPKVYGRTVTETNADLSALTEPQLLALGRKALAGQR